MALYTFGLFVLALLLISFLVSGFLLWLSCRLCRATVPARPSESVTRAITYRRSLAAVMLIAVLQLSVLAAGRALFPSDVVESFPFLPGEFVLGIALTLVCMHLILRTSWGKTVLVLLVWSAFGVGQAVAGVFAIRNTLAEAFVVPTGGMAETIRGYHKLVPCPHCRHAFPVNCSLEAQAPPGHPPFVTDRAVCPNCRHMIDFQAEQLKLPIQSGDRIAVGKGLLGGRFHPPERWDVVAFQYPVRASERGAAAIIYVDRLVGLPGETIAIHGGDLYTYTGLKYEGRAQPAQAELAWDVEYTYVNDEEATREFREGKFTILRKPPERILALRRLVYDNDHQNRNRPRRWVPEKPDGGWKVDNPDAPRQFTYTDGVGKELAWLRYRHLLENDGKPELITDFLGYNTYSGLPALNWVGDLMLECDLTVEQANGVFVLELARGVDRFQACLDLSEGSCTLLRLVGDREEQLSRQPVSLLTGKNKLCFANLDQRLTLWVNDALPFDEGVVYSPPEQPGPTAQDLQPAGLAVRGGSLSVSRLQLWRDAYWTVDTGGGDARGRVEWNDPSTWEELRQLPVKTMFVRPGHYFVLGDNSPESSDGRHWGLVPERLLLGKSYLIYYPLRRAGALR